MSVKPKLTLWSFCMPRPGYCLAFCLTLALACGVVLDRWMLSHQFPVEARDNLMLIGQAWKIIDNNYVDRTAIDKSALTDGAIKGMTEALGDTGHSVFLSATMLKRAGAAVEGSLTGIGIEIQNRNRQAVVVAPVDGSPAERAGVRPGDVILAVDGHEVTGLPAHLVADRIAGQPGQTVRLLVLTPRSGVQREVDVVRADIRIRNVTWSVVPGTLVAHVRVALFSDGVTGDLRAALAGIHREGISKIILDLRGNPGGVLDEAVGVASQFLPSGVVLWERNAAGRMASVPVRPGGLATRDTMVVLVNAGSGSASEIVAAALRDARRGPLIGETTFGTGTVLQQFPLPDGSALLLAVEEWLTPTKRSFWHKGLQPDFPVSLEDDAMMVMPAAERTMTAADFTDSGDAQLQRAIAYLTGPKEDSRTDLAK